METLWGGKLPRQHGKTLVLYSQSERQRHQHSLAIMTYTFSTVLYRYKLTRRNFYICVGIMEIRLTEKLPNWIAQSVAIYELPTEAERKAEK